MAQTGASPQVVSKGAPRPPGQDHGPGDRAAYTAAPPPPATTGCGAVLRSMPRVGTANRQATASSVSRRRCTRGSPRCAPNGPSCALRRAGPSPLPRPAAGHPSIPRHGSRRWGGPFPLSLCPPLWRSCHHAGVWCLHLPPGARVAASMRRDPSRLPDLLAPVATPRQDPRYDAGPEVPDERASAVGKPHAEAAATGGDHERAGHFGPCASDTTRRGLPQTASSAPGVRRRATGSP